MKWPSSSWSEKPCWSVSARSTAPTSSRPSWTVTRTNSWSSCARLAAADPARCARAPCSNVWLEYGHSTALFKFAETCGPGRFESVASTAVCIVGTARPCLSVNGAIPTVSFPVGHRWCWGGSSAWNGFETYGLAAACARRQAHRLHVCTGKLDTDVRFTACARVWQRRLPGSTTGWRTRTRRQFFWK